MSPQRWNALEQVLAATLVVAGVGLQWGLSAALITSGALIYASTVVPPRRG